MVVTINDIRKAGYCVAGARRWFELHGLDFKKMLDGGIPEDDLLATGDSMALEVVRRKAERDARG